MNSSYHFLFTMITDSCIREKAKGWQVCKEGESQDKEEGSWASESIGTGWVCWFMEGMKVCYFHSVAKFKCPKIWVKQKCSSIIRVFLTQTNFVFYIDQCISVKTYFSLYLCHSWRESLTLVVSQLLLKRSRYTQIALIWTAS